MVEVGITPPGPVLLTFIGDTVRLGAQPLDGSGDPVDGAAVSWSSSDLSVANIGSTGLVTAVGDGTAQIIAAAAGVKNQVVVNVQQAVAELDRLSGDGQRDTVRATLALPLRVQALDIGGSPIAGLALDFRAGGGTVTDATTTADGTADAAWTLGDRVGVQRVEIYAEAGRAPLAAFTATATPGAPAVLTLASGAGQTALPGATLGDPIVIRATDAYGNATAGATVDFAVRAGGGSVSPQQATTDADGLASAHWTLGHAAIEQRILGAVAGSADSASAAARVDTTRIFYVDAPATTAPGDTINIAVVTLLDGLGPDFWGAVTGSIRWDDGTLTPLVYYQNPGEVVWAVLADSRTLTFAVSRPANHAAADTIFLARFEVQAAATGAVDIDLTLGEVLAAHTFGDLRGEVGEIDAHLDAGS